MLIGKFPYAKIKIEVNSMKKAIIGGTGVYNAGRENFKEREKFYTIGEEELNKNNYNDVIIQL